MKPSKVYYEPEVLEYRLGKELQDKYKDLPWIPIENHNNIEELRTKENTEFQKLKTLLILGTRKTHKYSPNYKVSDYLVPFTSSGCTAMCLYCYLVCNYNKCSYLRIFVNREQMMERLIRFSMKTETEQVFEIGSNSDLILENTITGNLPWIVEEFIKKGRGKLTFPTKFNMIEPLLGLNHQERVIFRMSVNPQYIISNIEIGTASLNNRIEAVNKMAAAGYPVGLLIAPVILLPDWQKMYLELLDVMEEKLSPKVKDTMLLEIIFMTYSFIHRSINHDAFPEATELYDKELMRGRGMGKYSYKQDLREEGEAFLLKEIDKRFGKDKILYFS